MGRLGIFREVFVKAAIGGLTHQGVMALGHDLVVVFDEKVGLLAVFKKNFQTVSHPLGAHGLRGLAALPLQELVTGSGQRLDADGLALCADALLDVEDFLVFPCIDE